MSWNFRHHKNHHSTSAISAVFLDGETTVFHPWNLVGKKQVPRSVAYPCRWTLWQTLGFFGKPESFEDHPTNRNLYKMSRKITLLVSPLSGVVLVVLYIDGYNFYITFITTLTIHYYPVIKLDDPPSGNWPWQWIFSTSLEKRQIIEAMQ